MGYSWDGDGKFFITVTVQETHSFSEVLTAEQ